MRDYLLAAAATLSLSGVQAFVDECTLVSFNVI